MFLKRYADLKRSLCLTERGTTDEGQVTLLTEDTNKMDVLQSYQTSWPDVVFDFLLKLEALIGKSTIEFKALGFTIWVLSSIANPIKKSAKASLRAHANDTSRICIAQASEQLMCYCL